jgi:response regulator RpfG family c-di-GMP phosphodiesterase
MKDQRRNVLAVGLSPREFDRVAPFLSRNEFDLDRFPSGIGALELTSLVAIEVLIVRYPLRDMDLGLFLEQVRRPESRCLHSPILVLSTASELGEAEAFIGRGANRVIDIGVAEAQIQSIISDLLHVAPRQAARFLARLEIRLDDEQDKMYCQTENISITGMLIQTERRYDLGTKLNFEFNLPSDPRPISGVAEIVRNTTIGREQVGGIGTRFLSFVGDSQLRFQAYLQQI